MPFIRDAKSLIGEVHDGVVIVSSFTRQLEDFPALKDIGRHIVEYMQAHHTATSTANFLKIPNDVVTQGRLILSGTGPITRDFDDVRRFGTAAHRGMKLARSVGMVSPILVTIPEKKFPHAELVSALYGISPYYKPLNVREEEEAILEKSQRRDCSVGIFPIEDQDLLRKVHYLERSFTVCRDIGEQGPERMAPPRVAEYIKAAFSHGSNVKLDITDDQDVILKEYPLMHAVNRWANTVPEQRARLIRMEYTGEGPIEKTLFLVGKGVTLDTGGCDLKVSGHMFGMCRDKYGSAVVAGFFKALDLFKPPNIKVVGYMCMVRNSIGAKAYTCDEVITSRSGKRIHIYNTDAEGRITMLDPLTRAKDEALHAVNPHVITLATLTGHEILSYGYYASMMDNGPAKRDGLSARLQQTGDAFGQPIEISRLHPEDFTFHLAECPQAHLRQGNTKPSVQTLRGHQTPAAFLIMASGIEEHGCDSAKPLKFTHVDMGGCEGDHPDTSFPNPLLTLVVGLVFGQAL